MKHYKKFYLKNKVKPVPLGATFKIDKSSYTFAHVSILNDIFCCVSVFLLANPRWVSRNDVVC